MAKNLLRVLTIAQCEYVDSHSFIADGSLDSSDWFNASLQGVHDSGGSPDRLLFPTIDHNSPKAI
jgi:hypothetical protein